MKNLVWLASYPKSGNTWLRAFLSSYRYPDRALDLNRLLASQIASSRVLFDNILGIEAADLRPDEIEIFRAKAYRQLALEASEPQYIKAHDLYTPELFPADITKTAIYVVRNPMDVAISYSHHQNTTLKRALKQLSDPEHTLAPQQQGAPEQLPQRLGRWSEHVESWVECGAFCVRYEDMLAEPLATFRGIVSHLDGRVQEENLLSALAATGFQKLQELEQQQGFGEKPLSAKSFFREGKSDQWRESLTPKQVDLVVHQHGPVMRKFAYL